MKFVSNPSTGSAVNFPVAAHRASHAIGGSDALSLSDLGAARASIDQIAGLAPTLDLDFAGQRYRHYSAASGLREKPLADIVAFSRASSATYFDARGVMRTAPIDALPLDFDPLTGLCRGALIEDAATNLARYSSQLDNAVWAKNSNTTVTANNAAAPDGTTTAERVASIASGSAYTYYTIALTAGVPVTVAINVKAGSVGAVYLRDYTDAGVCSFVLATGVVGASGCASSPTIEGAGADWLRCSCTFTPTITGNHNLSLVNFSAAAAGSYAHFSEAQIEPGTVPTSYIETDAATAQRAASVLSLIGTPFDDMYTPVGTLMVKYARAGWKHLLSPVLTALDLSKDIVTSNKINDRIARVAFFPRELQAATIAQIKALL